MDWTSAAKGAVLVSTLSASRRSEILPRRRDRRSGASVVRHDAAINRMEDLNVKVCKEAITSKIGAIGQGRKGFDRRRSRFQDEETQPKLKAIAGHRDAAIIKRRDNHRNDESYGVAETLRSWLSGRCRPQASQIET
jgi:hypothetical protein